MSGLSFTLSADQETIRDMAGAFAATHLAPHALAWDRTKTFPVETIRQAAALGMAGIYVSEAHGGSGLSRLDAALIIEALATGCPTISAYISIHNMVAGMIDIYGDAAQKTAYLPRLCGMDWLASYCLTEPGAGSDAAALTTRAIADGDDYVLTGTKQFISGAGVSQLYLVMARTGGPGAAGVSAFLVEAGTPGLSFGPNEQKMGWNAQPTAQVIMQDCRIPAANRLGPEGTGFKIAMAGLDGGRINIGAASLGGAQAALDKTISYLGERKAFGQTLDNFQALQFRIADMATSLEAARLLLWRAATALDAQSPDATRLCAMAKRLATDTGFEVANAALQLHGGYGYLADYGVEKIVRDLRVHQILEGTNEIMRVIISRQLLKAG
ncbi:MAG: acyl-CoA dehydrogenase family protein [Acidocella sp.]|nr:acyl-CoA dehydrogenase family protein [Acidocella sp.]